MLAFCYVFNFTRDKLNALIKYRERKFFGKVISIVLMVPFIDGLLSTSSRLYKEGPRKWALGCSAMVDFSVELTYVPTRLRW